MLKDLDVILTDFDGVVVDTNACITYERGKIRYFEKCNFNK